jgi:hypothetical protein
MQLPHEKIFQHRKHKIIKNSNWIYEFTALRK